MGKRDSFVAKRKEQKAGITEFITCLKLQNLTSVSKKTTKEIKKDRFSFLEKKELKHQIA